MNNKEIVYWKQRNGELISIDNMDINHLRNILKMIIRNSQKVRKTYTHNATQAQELSDYQKLKESLNYRFHDDENRGNQWN
jgi:hypothetical protein